jgi:spoIIIJ-associated protein
MTATMTDGQQWLERLLVLMGLQTRVAAQSLAENHNWLEIDSQPLGEDIGPALLGKDGVILDAVQFLVNTHLNLQAPEGQEVAYTIELLGHRAARHSELLALAHDAQR